MQFVCLRCPVITETKIGVQWVVLEKDEAADCYKGVCSRCGAEVRLKGIANVDKAVEQFRGMKCHLKPL